MGRLIYSIHHLPDLTLIKYQSLSDGGLDGVLKRNESFLRQWQKISANYKVDLCYLVEYNPDFNAGERLRPTGITQKLLILRLLHKLRQPLLPKIILVRRNGLSQKIPSNIIYPVRIL